MIELTKENTTRAIERCKQLKPKVQFIADRTFAVKSANNPNVYTVRFNVENGKKLGECECKAGQQGRYVCYHLKAAATQSANAFGNSQRFNHAFERFV